MNDVAGSTVLGTQGSHHVGFEALGFHRHYDPHATLVLVGFFGAGKKTLGIIASVALRRRFIDFDTYFQQKAQCSPHEFIARHGLPKYRQLELKISREILVKHDKDFVIVGLGSFASRSQLALLTEFAQQHPIIYVRRDEQDLREFVTVNPDKFDQIIKLGNEFFESCTNFDFFNHTQGRPDQQTQPTYLKLKETERLFVTFLRRILGRPVAQTFSSNPLSKSNTLSLEVSLGWLETHPNLELLDGGTDAVTLVLMPNDITPADISATLSRHIATLRKNTRVPIIFDVEALSSKSQDPQFCCQILEAIARLAPDAVIISLDCNQQVNKMFRSAKGHTKLIAGLHDKRPVGSIDSPLTPSTLSEMTRFMQLDAIRIIGETQCTEDNLQCIKFNNDVTMAVDIPVIAYNEGPLGRSSICLNSILSPVMLPLGSSDGITAKGLQSALTDFFLLQKKKFTIFGQTVKQSLSPAMHNAAYDYCGLPHTYDIMLANDISAVQELMIEKGRGGVAISLPFKSAVLPYLNEITPDADDIQAVNTVVLEQKIQPDGSRVPILKGHNTDYIGVRDCIDKHLSPANAVREGTTALIIGAGGMARAATYACFELGVRRIFIYNRTLESAQKLANYWNDWARRKADVNFQVEVLSSTDNWPSDLRLPTIVVSCIPPFQLGSESPVVLQIPEQWLESRTGGVFVEVAYGPFKTQLMEQMLFRSSKGWVIVGGLVVLIEQGVAQYELFTKRPAPVHVMRRAIQEQSTKYGFIHQQSQVCTYI